MNLILNRKTALGVLIVVSSFFPAMIYGQQTPLRTDSYWVFVPQIYNPAIIGSKDYFSIGLNAAFQGISNTQLLSGNKRISKTHNGYFSSPDIRKFTNIGIGGAIFNDENGFSKNYGINASASYQIPLNTRELSFLSFGVAVKGSHSSISTDSSAAETSIKTNNFANADFGVYYYSTSFFTGVSGVNLLGSPWKPDTAGIFNVPVSREYFFTAGFKLLLSKANNIVIEPSVLISSTDSTFDKISENINPILKLYLDNFCLGASYRNGGKISIFAEYRYPKVFIGGYYGFKSKTPYFKDKPVVEFTLGLIIQSDKVRGPRSTHW
jgi:type IX secretion system PorP/SprF family membrane protein